MGIFSSFIQNGDNWYNRATFCLDAGNYQEAIAYYKEQFGIIHRMLMLGYIGWLSIKLEIL